MFPQKNNSGIQEVSYASITSPPCEASEFVQRVWHNHIKNGFLFHTDTVLAEWVRDSAAVYEFENSISTICRNIRGFSGGILVDRVPPLAILPFEVRHHMQSALNSTFDDGFSPDSYAGRITDKLSELMALVQNFPALQESRELARWGQSLRSAARELSEELQSLPKGYWVPDKI